jgi:MinD superfamily P-loop ATPase
MDVTICTTDPSDVKLSDIRAALEAADLFVVTVTIIDRDGNVAETDA